jgi:hypothetical protein
MHFVKDVDYVPDYKLILTFEDGSVKLADLEHIWMGRYSNH